MTIMGLAFKAGAVIGLGFFAVHAIGTSQGAGIQARPVHARCNPGLACPVSVTITNPGSGTETMTLRLKPRHHGRHVPPAWLTSAPVHLAAGKSAKATFTILVPARAHPGRYRAQIVAYGSSGFLAGHVNLGAGAGTRMTVTVLAPPTLTATNRRLTR